MKPVHLSILQVPTRHDEAWRRAVFDAAVAKGWRYYEEWAGNTVELDPSADGVMLTWADSATSLPADQWLVLMAAPDVALAEFCERFSLPQAEALAHVSERFAMIDELVRQGAGLVRSEAPAIVVPGLGEIANPAGDEATASAMTSSGPLAFYSSMPVAPDVLIRWPAEILHYPDSKVEAVEAGMCISLVGRRRLLTQGPHIVLPAGRWKMRVMLELETTSPVVMQINWASAGFEATLRDDGRYEIEFVVEESQRFRSDLRLQLMVPVLNGTLTVGESWIERLG